MPSPLSVTVPNVPWAVPLPRPNTIVAPPMVSCTPLASLAVRVAVAVPLTAMEVGETATVDWAGSAGPTTVTLGAGVVTAWLFSVAVIVLVPAVVPVKVAVYVPFPLSVTVLNVP